MSNTNAGRYDGCDPRIAAFAEIVERHDLHGLVFQHLALCRRRAWLHLNRIDYAHLDSRMALGTAAHDVAKPRDGSVTGLMGLAPDRIDWEGRLVIEAKNKAGAAEAVGRQSAFYALMLAAATGKVWQASNDILSARRRRAVPVGDEVIDVMLAMARSAAELVDQREAPPAERKAICGACSYRFLCGYD